MMCGRPSFSLVKLDGKALREDFAVPGIGLQELLVVRALLVPVRQEELVKYSRSPSHLCETMLSWAPMRFSYTCLGWKGSRMSNSRTLPSEKVSTHKKSSSEDREISTGSGTLVASPMSATAVACQSPWASSGMSQIFEVRAVVVRQ